MSYKVMYQWACANGDSFAYAIARQNTGIEFTNLFESEAEAIGEMNNFIKQANDRQPVLFNRYGSTMHLPLFVIQRVYQFK